MSHSARSNSTGVIAVIQREQRFLLIRRSQWVRKPGKICFPGGSKLVDEPEHETVRREVHEELGVAAIPQRRLHQSQSPWGTNLVWWQCQLEANPCFRLQRSEVAELLWLSWSEMRRHPDLLESNQSFLEVWRGGNSIG